MGMDGHKHKRNTNVLVIGGSGAGKSRSYEIPNALNCGNCSLVICDPKSEILRKTGGALKANGYEAVSYTHLDGYKRQVPICPKLSDSQYLQMENADEKREFQNISRQKLCRCRMLVVCGNEISNSMSAEIGTAEKRNIICTTLEGLAKIKESDEHDGL